MFRDEGQLFVCMLGSTFERVGVNWFLLDHNFLAFCWIRC